MFVFASAVACWWAERQLYRTAVLKVDSVDLKNSRAFHFEFSVSDGKSSKTESGVAISEFGENSFFKRTISSENFTDLVGVETCLLYTSPSPRD